MLKNLKIKDWRQFSNVDIDFHDRLTILTGVNGSGKTTVVNVLSTLFGWQASFPGRREDTTSASELSVDIEIGAKDIKTVLFESAWGEKNPSVYSLYQGTKPNVKLLGTSIHSNRPKLSYERLIDIPTKAPSKAEIFKEYTNYMKTYHRDKTSSYSMGKYSRHSLEAGTDNPAMLIIKQNLVALALFGFGNAVISGNEDAKSIFESYEDLLRKILPTSLGFNKIKINSEEVMLETDTTSFPIDGVSGGISSLIDITWQIFLLCEDENHTYTVIIDEPENHLHPQLQRTIMTTLLTAFPNVQFVIATHNPLIITSSKDCSIYALTYDETTESKKVRSQKLDDINLSSTSNKILHQILGVESTIPEWVIAETKGIIAKYSELPFTIENADKMENELASIGLAEHTDHLLEKVLSTDGVT